VPLPAETIAELGRETRGHDGEKEIVGHEIRFQAIPPENLTALVCGHKARAVAEWDDEPASSRPSPRNRKTSTDEGQCR
jgi:hypothetical protein